MGEIRDVIGALRATDMDLVQRMHRVETRLRVLERLIDVLPEDSITERVETEEGEWHQEGLW